MKILDSIASWAAREPERPALLSGDRVVTYGSLVAEARDRAAALADRGFCRGHRLLFSAPDDPAYVVALLACAELGVTFVPLGHAAPPAWRDRLSRATGAAADCTGLDDLGRTGPARPPAEPTALTILFTSGTEGDPKGVVLTEETCRAGAENAAAELELGPGDGVLCYVPLHLVGGMYILVLPALMRGGRVVLARFDPFAFASIIERTRPSVTILLPAFLQLLRGTKGWDGLDLSCLRTVVAGAAVVPGWVPGALLRRGAGRFQHFFGSTECLTPIFANRCLDPDDPHATAFDRVCGDYAVRLAPDGELLVRGAAVCDGYLDGPATESGWFRTGDVFREEDGRWWFEGRKHDRLNVNGRTVSPVLTEKVIADVPGVAEAVVTAGVRRSGVDELVAVVAGSGVDVAAVRERCRTLLDQPQQPRRVVVVEDVPRNAMGKPDRRAVRELLEEREERDR